MRPIYFSRLLFNLSNPMVQRDLNDCGLLHKRMLTAFPTYDLPDMHAREACGLLYRVEQQVHSFYLLAQSTVKPDWDQFPEEYWWRPNWSLEEPAAVKVITPHIVAGQQMRFRILGNTIKTRFIGVGVRSQKIPISDDEEKVGWLQRKLGRAGLRVDTQNLMLTRFNPVTGNASDGTKVIKTATRFDGMALVEEPEPLMDAMLAGIGGGRAWGLGLLSLQPVRSEA